MSNSITALEGHSRHVLRLLRAAEVKYGFARVGNAMTALLCARQHQVAAKQISPIFAVVLMDAKQTELIQYLIRSANRETGAKTMCRRNRILFVLAIIPTVVTALVFMRGVLGTPRITLEAIRIAPKGDVRQDIVSSSFAPVDFQYRIVNRGRSPLAGLKLGTSCACEITAAPPGEIAPGGSAVIGFRLRAPYAGRLQRQIPITVEGIKEPLLMLNATVRVRFDPPAIIPTTQDHNLLFVKGDASPREFVFETIEKRENKPWIEGLELNPSDTIEVHPRQLEDSVEQDPELVRRRYRIPLSNRLLDVGQHAITAVPRTRKEGPSIVHSFALRLSVVDSVAIVPNPLVIKHTPGTQALPLRVSVINRTKTVSDATPTKYDEDVLHVRSTDRKGSSVQTFDIVPLEQSQGEFETPVIFDIGNGESRELVVRFTRSSVP